MIPFAIYDILEKVKPQGQKSDQGLPGPEHEKGTDYKRRRGHFFEIFCILIFGSGYTTVGICLNS